MGLGVRGTPVELGHLQDAREFLLEIKQDLLGGGEGASWSSACIYIYICTHLYIYIYTHLYIYIYIKCSPQPHSPNSCSDVELRAIVFVSEEETSQRLRKEVRLILLLLSLLSAETTRRLIRTWTMHILKGLEPHTIRKGLELQNLCTIACFWWANHRQNDAIPSYPGFVPETALPTYQKYSKML